jgi:hypothetical protein
VVTKECEVAVRRDEGDNVLSLPPLEANTRMEASVFHHTVVHERHGQVGHTTQLTVTLDLNKQQQKQLVNNYQ